MKYKRGDWVAIPAPGAQTGYKPCKVVDATRESVTVEARFDNGARRLTFTGEGVDRIVRIRWRRLNGRARWELAR